MRKSVGKVGKVASFQKSCSTHFVFFFCNNNIVHFYKQLNFFKFGTNFFPIFLFLNLCWSFFNMQAKFWNGKMKTVGVINLSNLSRALQRASLHAATTLTRGVSWNFPVLLIDVAKDMYTFLWFGIYVICFYGQ